MASIADIEKTRLVRQREIDAARSAEDRNRLGQFATPGALAHEILNLAHTRWGPGRGRVRFLDPALGTGSFFAALVKEFGPASIESATGYELDETFARTADALWRDYGLAVIHGDFTTARPPRLKAERPNLIVCNPPYVRHHHIAAEEKLRLQRLAGSLARVNLNGLAGLYCYFLLLAHAWMADDALALWLIPSEFMDVNYGRAVREYLCTQVRLLRVHRFDPAEVQFDDALVSSAVVLLENTPVSPSDRVELTYGGSLASPGRTHTVTVRELAQSSNWSGLSRHRHGERKPMADGAERDVTVGDLFEIKRGLATGANDFFILERARAAELELPATCLTPILPSPRYLSCDVIEGDADGFPVLEKQLVLLDCRLPESTVRNRYPRLWTYLASGRKAVLPNRYLCKGRQPWYRQELRPPAPFLCTYMGREGGEGPFRFIWNQSRATATNVYLLMYPRGAMREALKSDPGQLAKVHAALKTLSPQDIVGEGRTYGGGLHKIEPRELGRLSARALTDALPQLVRFQEAQGRLF
ncbi:MAG: Eco57I restriction-modification methylase domain-containing protein [Phycisphaerae bacterium]